MMALTICARLVAELGMIGLVSLVHLGSPGWVDEVRPVEAFRASALRLASFYQQQQYQITLLARS